MKKSTRRRLVSVAIVLVLALLLACSLMALRMSSDEKEAYRIELLRQEELMSQLSQEYESVQSHCEELETEIAELTDLGNGVQKHGQLAVQDGQLVSESGEHVVLNGFSSHGLTWFPRFTNAAALATTKEYGANVFRVAMYTDQNEGYAYMQEENKNFMYMAVENTLSQDMYAIIDWHVLRDETPMLHIDKAIEFFEEVSSRYSNQKGIIYEICNEPNHGTTWEEIVEYADVIIPIIRKNAPEAVILVGTPEYCSDLSGPMENPLKYDNILYSYHRYIDVSNDEQFVPGSIEDATDENLPIFVTEWGISYGELDDEHIDSPKDSNLNFDKAWGFVDYMEEHELSWCGWSLSNKPEAYSAILPQCTKLSGWTEEDMTPSGVFMMQALMKERISE